MTSKERVIKTLKHQSVDRAPRDLWVLPGVSMFCQNEVGELMRRFPMDFQGVENPYGKSTREKGIPNRIGQYTDEWGSVFHVGEDGVIGEVKEPLLADWSSLKTYKPPFELLKGFSREKVNKACVGTDKFIRVGTYTRPFERMQFLRGTENLFLDLAYGTAEVFTLAEMLHDFNRQEMELWASTDVDGVGFMDDWGSQNSLLISPEMWRKIFKPLYKDYADILHKKGKFVFMHSDGNISSIYPDLVEIGIDAMNSQLFCMDIEDLGEKYSGKITFWGEIDRQHVLPTGDRTLIQKAVQRVRTAMDHGKGGVIAQCEWGNDVSGESVAAVFEEWEKPPVT